jgi:hypothetical protein
MSEWCTSVSGRKKTIACGIATLAAGIGLIGCGGPESVPGQTPVATMENDEPLTINETFSEVRPDEAGGLIHGAHDWWVEGGERVWVEDGRLHVKADPEDENDPRYVATVWCRTPIAGDVRIEMKAHVIDSTVGANNINIFFFYSDPGGEPLFDTREDRADAAYRYYHDLDGYIVTFLSDRQEEMGVTEAGHPNARFRLRRCPGFNLVDESYHPMGVLAGRTYDLTIIRRDGVITFQVDGETFLEWEDEDPLREGLLGLRTFRTYLWWDAIRVYPLD